MFRQGQLAVHGLAILLGRNEAGISNRGKFFLHHTVHHADLQSFLKTMIKYELIKFISGHPYLPWEDGETSQCRAPARELDPCGLDQKTLS